MSPPPRRRLSTETKIILSAVGVFVAVSLGAGWLLFSGAGRSDDATPESTPADAGDPVVRAHRLLDLQKGEPDALKRWHGEWTRLLKDAAGTAAESTAARQIAEIEEKAERRSRDRLAALDARVDALVTEGKFDDARDALASWTDPDGLDLTGAVSREVRQRTEGIDLLVRLREEPGRYRSELEAGRDPGPPSKALKEFLSSPDARVRAAAEKHARELAHLHFPHAFRLWIKQRKFLGADALKKVRKELADEKEQKKSRYERWEKRLQELTRSRPISGQAYGLKGVGNVRFGPFDGEKIVLRAFDRDLTLDYLGLPTPLLALTLESAPDPEDPAELYEAGMIAARSGAYDSAERLFEKAGSLKGVYRALAPSVDRLRHGIGKLHADGRLNADQIYLRYDFDRASQAEDFKPVVGPNPIILNGSMILTGGPKSFTTTLPAVEFSRRLTIKVELPEQTERSGNIVGVLFQVIPGQYEFLFVAYDPSRTWRIVFVDYQANPTLIAQGRIPRPRRFELRINLANLQLRADGRSVWEGRNVPILPMRPIIGGYPVGGDQIAKVTYPSIEFGGRCTPKWIQRLHSERRALIEKEFTKGSAALEYMGAVAAVKGAQRDFGADLLQPLAFEALVGPDLPDPVPALLRRYREFILKTKTAASPVQFDRAITDAGPVLDELVREAEFFFPALFYRAELKFARGDLKGALADLDAALASEADFAEARVARAQMYLLLDRLEEATKDVERALETAPDLAHARLVRSLLHYHESRKEAADEELETAVRLTPRDWELRRSAKRLGSIFRGPRWSGSYRLETDHYVIRAEVPGAFDGVGLESRKVEVLGRAREGARTLEAARKWFAEFVPYPGKPRKKAIVHLFASAESYFFNATLSQGTRMEHSLGYYQPAVRQLFFYRGRSERETTTTMVHEAFHEYMYSRIRTIPPWFDEGLAEYVGALRIEDGKVVETGRIIPMRREILRAASKSGWPGIPFKVMLQESREQFMGLLPALQYAQAWSMIHFLIHHENGKYRPLFEKYLKEVIEGASAEELFTSVFADQDLGTMELEWIDYVSRMP